MEVKEEKIESEISKSAVLQNVSDELDLKAKKYLRGDGANLEVLQDKKLKGQLAVREKLYGQSAKAAAKAEKWLLPCEEGYLEGEGLEKTWRIKQEDILKEVDNNSSRKPFDMILPELGPYTLGYTTSGRYMMMGGRKGHLAMIDMISMDLIKEFQVRETVRDVVFLQNDHFLAVAQKKNFNIPVIARHEALWHLSLLSIHISITGMAPKSTVLRVSTADPLVAELRSSGQGCPSASLQTGNGIALFDKQDVFIPDDLLLKDLFDEAAEASIFIWYPPMSHPSFSRAKMNSIFGSIGIKTISGAIKKDQFSLSVCTDFKKLDSIDTVIKNGLLKIVVGFLAS